MATPANSTPDPIDEANLPTTGAWYAWNNMMPLRPNHIHVLGSVDVPNLGIEPELTVHAPQSTSPSTLVLELRLHQKPGSWAQATVRKKVQYRAVFGAVPYAHVMVLLGSRVLVAVEAETVHLSLSDSDTGTSS